MGQQTTEDQGAKRQFERQNTCEGGIIGTEVPSQGSTVPVKRQLIHILGPWNSSGMGDTGSSADSNGAANRMAARSGLEPSFLTLAVLTREAGEFFAWGLSCIVGALATSLVSLLTRCQQHPLSRVVTTKKVCRHRQIPFQGQNFPQLRITDLRDPLSLSKTIQTRLYRAPLFPTKGSRGLFYEYIGQRNSRPGNRRHRERRGEALPESQGLGKQVLPSVTSMESHVCQLIQ